MKGCLFMDSYKNMIDKCTDLESLFSIWKKAHLEEKYFEHTFPKDPEGKIPPKEFCKNWNSDGFLSDNRGNIDVLFILKESNDQGAIDNNDFFDRGFWIKDNINNFSKAICRRTYCIATKKINNELTKENWIEHTAIMNLNKRGGYSSCNKPFQLNQLANYTETYKDFILKEIKIINPRAIVFMCGVDFSKRIISILDVSQYEVYCAPHPAYRVSDDDYLEKLEKYSKN